MTNGTLDFAWDTGKRIIVDAFIQYIRDMGHGVNLNDREESGVRYHSIEYIKRSIGTNVIEEIIAHVSIYNHSTGEWEPNDSPVLDFSPDCIWVMIDETEKQYQPNT